jgi:hypothetical protein
LLHEDKTWGRSFQHPRENGMRGYHSSCCPIQDHLIKPQAQCSQAWCLGESYAHPATCCPGVPRQGASHDLTWWTSWNGCRTSITMPANIWVRPVTGWRPATTAYPTLQDSRKETKSGFTTRPRPDGAAFLTRLLQAHHPDQWCSL